MNIESAKLSTLASSAGSVENQSVSSNTGSVGFSGFSGALDATLGQLQNGKVVVDTSTQVSGLVGLQVVNEVPVIAGAIAGTGEMQSIAALMGNSLPPTYKIKDETSHEAALAAVTDTLKYITTGTTAGEKAAEAAKNLTDVIAMTVPVQQSIKSEVAGVVAVQNSIEGTTPIVVKENINPVIVAPVEQGSKELAETSNSEEMTLNQQNAELEKKKIELAESPESARQGQGLDGVIAEITIVPLVFAGQAPVATDLGDGEVSSTYMKSLNSGPNASQSGKKSDSGSQNPIVFGQAVQGNHGFNLKSSENATSGEQRGETEQSLLVAQTDKAVSRIGIDGAQLNKAVTDTKLDLTVIAKPVNHPEWNKDLAERIVWMSNKAIPTAEIRLNPPHLGPISVRVDVVDEQANVVFTAQHGATREAIEASIPKLREMMGQQQLNLVEVSVSQSPGGDQGRSQSQNFSHTAGGSAQGKGIVDGVEDIDQEIDSGRASVSKGLLSIYA